MSKPMVYAIDHEAAGYARPRPAGGGGGARTFMIAFVIMATLIGVGGVATNLEFGAAPRVDPASLPRVAGGEYKSAYAGEGPPAPATASLDRALAGADAPPPPIIVQAPAQTDGYLAQIASLKSPEAADAAWSRLTRMAPALFAPLDKEVQTADLGDKGVYYRLRAGPFPSRDAAEAFCAEVRGLGQGCFPAKR